MYDPAGLGIAVALPILPQLAGMVVNVTVGGVSSEIVTDVSALHSPLGLVDVMI